MAKTLQQMMDEVRYGLADKLRVRGRSLEAQIRKAGRLLPRGVKRNVVYLAQAVALAKNPKCARMVDLTKARQAHGRVLGFLDGIDVGARHRAAALRLAASIAFGLLVTGVVLLFVLVQRGFV